MALQVYAALQWSQAVGCPYSRKLFPVTDSQAGGFHNCWMHGSQQVEQALLASELTPHMILQVHIALQAQRCSAFSLSSRRSHPWGSRECQHYAKSQCACRHDAQGTPGH